MDKETGKKKKIISSILSVFCLLIVVLFFTTDLSARVFNNKEYNAYKYAIECVEDKLKFPNTATYPSFKETKIEKSKYGAAMILDSYSGGKSFEYAWDISGSGTCENALGMEINYNFIVTVVMSEYETFWCYKCTVN